MRWLRLLLLALLCSTGLVARIVGRPRTSNPLNNENGQIGSQSDEVLASEESESVLPQEPSKSNGLDLVNNVPGRPPGSQETGDPTSVASAHRSEGQSPEIDDDGTENARVASNEDNGSFGTVDGTRGNADGSLTEGAQIAMESEGNGQENDRWPGEEEVKTTSKSPSLIKNIMENPSENSHKRGDPGWEEKLTPDDSDEISSEKTAKKTSPYPQFPKSSSSFPIHYSGEHHRKPGSQSGHHRTKTTRRKHSKHRTKDPHGIGERPSAERTEGAPPVSGSSGERSDRRSHEARPHSKGRKPHRSHVKRTEGLPAGTSVDQKPPLLLIVAIDGLRHDFLNEDRMPNLAKLAKRGAWAKNGMRPVFPTSTTPNFVSLSTGLYTENSGILDNFMLNMSTGKEVFDYWGFHERDHPVSLYESSRNPSWYHGTPFWMLNDKAGKGRASGSMMWPTSDVHYGGGQTPKYLVNYTTYVQPTRWEGEVDTVLDWFVKEDPVNFAMLYIEEPDSTEHRFAIESDQVANVIDQCDQLVGYLMDKVEKSPSLKDRLNLIILSDHGHVTVPVTVDMTPYLGDAAGTVTYALPNILPVKYPDTVDWDDVYAKLKPHERDGHFVVYRKSEIPEKYHVAKNPYVYKLIIIPEPGYFVSFTKGFVADGSGGHGSFSSYADVMHGIFVAYGPQIKSGHDIPIFDNVNVYEAVCRVLGVSPASNDGAGALMDIFKRQSGQGATVTPQWVDVSYHRL